jgi:uncharacterized protein YhaN
VAIKLIIKRLYISGFGKLTKKDLELKEGLNILYGDNETGKSTVLAYIKAMLYNAKEANKYIPWNADNFNSDNNILLKLDNENEIKIEKNFNNKTKIYSINPFKDITSEFPIEKNKVLIGEKLLNLDVNSFESSALIVQGGTKLISNNKKDLKDRLMKLSQYGNEDIDYLNALDKLKGELNEIGIGKAGKHKKLIKINNTIEDIELRKEEAYKTLRNLYNLSKKEKMLSENLKTLETEIENINDKISNNKAIIAGKYIETSNRVKALEEEKNKIENEIKNIISSYNLNNIDIEKVKYTLTIIEKYNNEKSLLNERKERLNKKSTNYNQEINKEYLIQGKKNLEKDRIKSLKTSLTAGVIISTLVIILAFILGIIYGSLNYAWYAILAIIPISLYLIINYQKSINIIMKEYYKKLNEIETKGAIKDNHLLESLIEETEEEIDNIGIKIKAAYKELQELLGKEKTEENIIYTANIYIKKEQEKEILINKIKEIDKEISILKSNILILGNNVDINNLDLTLCSSFEFDENISSLENKKQEFNNELKKIEVMLASTTKELELTEENYIHPGDLEEELYKLFNEKNKLINKKESIELAIEYLKISFDEIQKNYIPELNNNCQKYIKFITNNKYQEIFTDTELNTFLKDEENGIIDINNLSYSTIEQVYLAFRLSLIKLLSKEEKIPLFIDEPFAYYDENRHKNTLLALREFSKTHQVILFTCQKKDINLIENIFTSYNLLYL